MGSSWSLSILNLSPGPGPGPGATLVEEGGTLGVNAQKVGRGPLGSLGHGVAFFFRKQ